MLGGIECKMASGLNRAHRWHPVADIRSYPNNVFPQVHHRNETPVSPTLWGYPMK